MGGQGLKKGGSTLELGEMGLRGRKGDLKGEEEDFCLKAGGQGAKKGVQGLKRAFLRGGESHSARKKWPKRRLGAATSSKAQNPTTPHPVLFEKAAGQIRETPNPSPREPKHRLPPPLPPGPPCAGDTHIIWNGEFMGGGLGGGVQTCAEKKGGKKKKNKQTQSRRR